MRIIKRLTSTVTRWRRRPNVVSAYDMLNGIETDGGSDGGMVLLSLANAAVIVDGSS